MSDEKSPDPGQMQGEGDYKSARKFDKEQAAFANSGRVEHGAAQAEAALDGPEGPELEAARQAADKGESVNKGG